MSIGVSVVVYGTPASKEKHTREWYTYVTHYLNESHLTIVALIQEWISVSDLCWLDCNSPPGTTGAHIPYSWEYV